MGWGRARHWGVPGCSRWQHVRACSWAAHLGGGHPQLHHGVQKCLPHPGTAVDAVGAAAAPGCTPTPTPTWVVLQGGSMLRRACSWAAHLGGGSHSCTTACKSVYHTQGQPWMQWGLLQRRLLCCTGTHSTAALCGATMVACTPPTLLVHQGCMRSLQPRRQSATQHTRRACPTVLHVWAGCGSGRPEAPRSGLGP